MLSMPQERVRKHTVQKVAVTHFFLKISEVISDHTCLHRGRLEIIDDCNK